ncbi:MAG: hypothetical protein ACI81O_001469, partial [Cyclobacteriaceae bacterium]
MRRCTPMRALLSVPRPMPWADFSGEGLVFVAFAGSFYAFDAILKRM